MSQSVVDVDIQRQYCERVKMYRKLEALQERYTRDKDVNMGDLTCRVMRSRQRTVLLFQLYTQVSIAEWFK